MDFLVFEPYLRAMVWGGRRLAEMGKALPTPENYGESWEISAHPHHVSRVAEGPLRGALLTDLCTQRTSELFGPSPPPSAAFPWLVKLLDCQEKLSIQVHPNDEQARRLSAEATGKTETWLVLDVQDHGWIYAGLKPGTDRAALERHLQEGTVADCVHRFQPRPGDCIFLPAGTVHAAVGGVVLAEVQQSSDVTFRLFDWNRPGTDGKPRPLHIRESLESIDWNAGPVSPIQGTTLPDLPAGVRGERLVRCPFFDVQRYQVHAPFRLPEGKLAVWLVAAGAAELSCVHGLKRRFRRGETVLVPASSPSLAWRPEPAGTTLLAAFLP